MPDRKKKFKIVLAEQDYIVLFGAEVDVVLEAMGHPEALVTDISCVSDFCLTKKELASLREELGVRVSDHDYVWEVAERVRKRASNQRLSRATIGRRPRKER
jgi:hypothetical protein